MIKNRARCKNCNTIIESLTQHDFVTCSCFTNTLDNTGIFVDGGTNCGYIRAGGCIENFEELYYDDDLDD